MELLGRKGRIETVVGEMDTASAWGSGLLPVFSTPRLVALMEGAACRALEGALEEGGTTVGVRIDIKHTAATPLGMRVWAEAEITQVDGRALTFAVEAFDEKGSIGHAQHERFIIDADRFMKKVEARSAK